MTVNQSSCTAALHALRGAHGAIALRHQAFRGRAGGHAAGGHVRAAAAREAHPGRGDRAGGAAAVPAQLVHLVWSQHACYLETSSTSAHLLPHIACQPDCLPALTLTWYHAILSSRESLPNRPFTCVRSSRIDLGRLLDHAVERGELDVLTALVSNVPSLAPDTALGVGERLTAAAVAACDGWRPTQLALKVRLNAQDSRHTQGPIRDLSVCGGRRW